MASVHPRFELLRASPRPGCCSALSTDYYWIGSSCRQHAARAFGANSQASLRHEGERISLGVLNLYSGDKRVPPPSPRRHARSPGPEIPAGILTPWDVSCGAIVDACTYCLTSMSCRRRPHQDLPSPPLFLSRFLFARCSLPTARYPVARCALCTARCPLPTAPLPAARAARLPGCPAARLPGCPLPAARCTLLVAACTLFAVRCA